MDQEPHVASQPPTLSPQKSSPILPILFVLLILLAASTIYLGYQNMQLQKQIKELSMKQITPPSSPTPNSTANWKTYTNANLGFSFHYPGGAYKINEYNTLVSIGADQTGGLMFEVEKKPNTIISREFDADKLTYKEYIDLKLPEPILKNGIVNGYQEQETVFPSAAQGADMRKIYFQQGSDVYTVILQPDANDIKDTIFDQILSTFKFSENPVVSIYKYGTFSFSYPKTWQLSENTSDNHFFAQNKISGFNHMVLLQNGDNYFIIGIDTPSKGAKVEGIFFTDADYQDYVTKNDLVMIQNEKFYLSKNNTTLQQWNNPQREEGIYGLANLSEYVPNKVTNTQNKTFNGNDFYITKNGKSYMFIKLSKMGVSEVMTSPTIQNDIMGILQTITW